VYGL